MDLPEVHPQKLGFTVAEQLFRFPIRLQEVTVSIGEEDRFPGTINQRAVFCLGIPEGLLRH
jgi:hypothetical protein